MNSQFKFDPKLMMTRGGGMMLPKVYQKIYDTALACGGGHIVEIGTGSGASALALAFGLRDSGHGATSQVHTVDQMGYGDSHSPDANQQKFLSKGYKLIAPIDKRKEIPEIKRAFEELGFGELITFYPESPATAQKRFPSGMRISGLLLDADGCLDRDFTLFYNQLRPGGFIIIDDCDGKSFAKVQRRFWHWGIHLDQKHKLTFELMEVFTRQGLLTDISFCGGTCFAKKPLSATSDVDFKAIDVLPAYRKLIMGCGVYDKPLLKFLKTCWRRFWRYFIRILILDWRSRKKE